MKDLFIRYKKMFFSKISKNRKSDNMVNVDNAEVVDNVDTGNNVDKNTKKRTENIIVFIVILIITVIMINSILKDNGKENSKLNSDNNKQLVYMDEEDINKEEKTIVNKSNFEIDNTLENKLEDILNKMQGVGKVKVLITYSKTSQIVPVYNETSKNSINKEADSEGRDKTSRRK